jgi:signal transduction histidine kinase
MEVRGHRRAKAEKVMHTFFEKVQNLGSRSRVKAAPSRNGQEQVSIQAPSPQTIESFRNFAKWASITAMLAGYHVLLGWAFDIDVLKRPWSSFSSMKANTAVCSILAGVALYLWQTQRPILRKHRLIVIRVCASITAAIALLTLSQFLFGVNLGIDQLLFGQAALSDDISDMPGRMAPMSAIAFAMIGIALLLIESRRDRLCETLALVSGAISMLAIAGYIYQARTFIGQMPLYSAVVAFLTSGGILCARADRGLMTKVTSNSFGGIMARRLLPATLLIPIVLGWLQHEGRKAGFYTSEPGLALLTVANVVVFLSVVWWGVNSLHRMDTKRREAEQELQETAAKLARSNADLEQFAYVASHDLKEPLRAISGSIQILQERFKEELEPDADEVIKHTVDGATRMQTLIDDLLAYSRLTTREAPFEETDCELVLEEVLANLKQLTADTKAVVTHDPLPVVRADRTQILQVFQNLISNGIKYRSERTPKIHVGVEDKRSEWLFSIRDNGIGIAPQYADRIFRIFQRLHTRREYSGTGIGLAVCKKIVERHGGRIWVESEPEEGSTFYFTLPKAQER